MVGQLVMVSATTNFMWEIDKEAKNTNVHKWDEDKGKYCLICEIVIRLNIDSISWVNIDESIREG